MIKSFNRAFTILELLIAISLLGVVLTFLYSALDNFRTVDKKLEQKSGSFDLKNEFLKYLYLDFMTSKSFKVTNIATKFISEDKNFDMIEFQSKNSLFQIDEPYILYIVIDNYLYRIESPKEIPIPLEVDRDNNLFISKIGEFESFRVYNNGKKVLIYYKFLNSKENFLEFNLL